MEENVIFPVQNFCARRRSLFVCHFHLKLVFQRVEEAAKSLPSN